MPERIDWYDLLGVQTDDAARLALIIVYVNHNSIRTAARHLGVDHGSLSRAMTRFGVKKRRRGPQGPRK